METGPKFWGACSFRSLARIINNAQCIPLLYKIIVMIKIAIMMMIIILHFNLIVNPSASSPSPPPPGGEAKASCPNIFFRRQRRKTRLAGGGGGVNLKIKSSMVSWAARKLSIKIYSRPLGARGAGVLQHTQKTTKSGGAEFSYEPLKTL